MLILFNLSGFEVKKISGCIEVNTFQFVSVHSEEKIGGYLCKC